jgi:sulfur carrier protein
MSDIPLENTLQLRFNGTPLVIAAGTTLGGLLAQQDLAPDAVATAVNARFVARALREAHPLNEGDEVLTFQAIVGG